MRNLIKNIFHIDHVIVAFLTIIIIELMVTVAINLDFLNPVVRAFKSFSITDIYYKIQNSEEPTKVCNTITLVDMTELTQRRDIAQVIRKINEMKPSILGIDIIFEGEKSDLEGDRLLAEACLSGNTDKTVFAYKLTNYSEINHSYQNSLHSFFSMEQELNEGFVNLIDNPEKSVKRYANTLPYQDKLEYSFPYLISKIATKKEIHNEEIHIINYKSIAFLTISYNELDKYKEYIKDHIVLLGTAKEEKDSYYTPIGQKSGMEILAYTILSMIDNIPIQKANQWIVLLWALIAGYITNMIDFLLTKRVKKRQSMIMIFITQSELYDKVLSFFVMVLITWVSFELYTRCNYFIDAVLPLATIILIEEGRLLYIGILSILEKKKYTKIVNRSVYAKDLE